MAYSRSMEDLGRLATETELSLASYGVGTERQIIQARYGIGREQVKTFCRYFSRERVTASSKKHGSSEKDETTEHANYLLRHGKNEIKIVVLGRLGYGKSALVNTLFGKEVTKESDSARPILTVTCHTSKIYGINVTIVDTPGFFCVQKSSDDILKDIKDKAAEGDLVLFCIKMTERFSDSEEELIKMIESEMGVDILAHHTVFALTFANMISLPRRSISSAQSVPMHGGQLAEHFKKKLEEMKEEIYGAIGRHTDLTGSQIERIPVVPVGYDERQLPNIDDWVVPFWYTCFKCINPLSKVAFFTIGLKQMTEDPAVSYAGSLNQEDAGYLHNILNSDPDDRHILQKLLDLLAKIFSLDNT